MTPLYQKIQSRERLGRGGYGTIKLNLTGEEKVYIIIEETHGPTQENIIGWYPKREYIYTTTLQEVVMVKEPSKEQIAAEESVAKAREALKAAENALRAVKEGQ